MPEALCVKGCGGKARRNPESKGMCLDCSLKEENRSVRKKTSVTEEVCACGAKSTDPGATRFKDGKCKKCRSKEAQQRWYEKHKKGEARKRSPEAKPGSEARKRSPEAKPGSEARKRSPEAKPGSLIVTVDFSAFPEMHRQLTEESIEEMRPPEMQILFLLKQCFNE